MTTESDILVFHPEHSRLDSLKLTTIPGRTTAGDWQVAVQERLAREPSEEVRQRLKAVLKEPKPPARLPVFDAIFVDPFFASVWIRPYGRETERVWRRTSEEGSLLNQFTLPANVEVLDVGKETLLGLQRNNDGTEDVLLFAFKR